MADGIKTVRPEFNLGTFKSAAARLFESGGTWTILAALLLLFLAGFSVENIEPGEVAIKVNNLTGSQTAITSPGWVVRVPTLQSVYKIDAKPQTFHMQGKSDIDLLNVAELTVRASDGSNFHFSDTTIIFQITGDDVVRTVEHSGVGYKYLEWMRPFARSVLRDEFGRESTIHVSDPTTYGTAANRAKERLNEELAPHGIRVSQLVTPRPQFNKEYETAIEDRNSLSNELEVIKSDLDRAATDRARQLAELDQQKNNVVQQTRAKMETALAEAVAQQASVRNTVDTYRIKKIGDGQASLSGSHQIAKELQGELEARYQSKEAEISAFRNQPVERVMEKLGERLAGITFLIQPWADDAQPSRLKYEEIKK